MKRIAVPEEGIETLFGSYDENLKHLEAQFGVRIRTQMEKLGIKAQLQGTSGIKSDAYISGTGKELAEGSLSFIEPIAPPRLVLPLKHRPTLLLGSTGASVFRESVHSEAVNLEGPGA